VDASVTAAGFEITLADSAVRFTCAPGQNVLAALARAGANGIPVGCRGGGCGICRVQVVEGSAYRTEKMSRAQVSEKDARLGICLACKLIPEGHLVLRPLGRLVRAAG
jgi:ferredoxin